MLPILDVQIPLLWVALAIVAGRAWWWKVQRSDRGTVSPWMDEPRTTRLFRSRVSIIHDDEAPRRPWWT